MSIVRHAHRLRPRISAVVIAQNEERNLPGLFAALSWVDEVVLLDGGSSDGTLPLAQRLGARCAVRRFDNYAAQRNHAIELASGDWILSIDSDERPTPPLAAEVRRRVGTGEAVAYRISIRSKIFGRPFRFSGTQDDRPIRLFERTKARWSGAVHERLTVDGPVATLAVHLEHETIPNLAAFLTKMHRYASLSAAAAVEQRMAPRRAARWIAPAREFARRLLFKQGWLDGPEGWAFCCLSGLAAWVEADQHRRLWMRHSTEAIAPRA